MSQNSIPTIRTTASLQDAVQSGQNMLVEEYATGNLKEGQPLKLSVQAVNAQSITLQALSSKQKLQIPRDQIQLSGDIKKGDVLTLTAVNGNQAKLVSSAPALVSNAPQLSKAALSQLAKSWPDVNLHDLIKAEYRASSFQLASNNREFQALSQAIIKLAGQSLSANVVSLNASVKAATANGVSIILQGLDSIPDSDKSLTFPKLEGIKAGDKLVISLNLENKSVVISKLMINGTALGNNKLSLLNSNISRFADTQLSRIYSSTAFSSDRSVSTPSDLQLQLPNSTLAKLFKGFTASNTADNSQWTTIVTKGYEGKANQLALKLVSQPSVLKVAIDYLHPKGAQAVGSTVQTGNNQQTANSPISGGNSGASSGAEQILDGTVSTSNRSSEVGKIVQNASMLFNPKTLALLEAKGLDVKSFQNQVKQLISTQFVELENSQSSSQVKSPNRNQNNTKTDGTAFTEGKASQIQSVATSNLQKFISQLPNDIRSTISEALINTLIKSPSGEKAAQTFEQVGSNINSTKMATNLQNTLSKDVVNNANTEGTVNEDPDVLRQTPDLSTITRLLSGNENIASVMQQVAGNKNSAIGSLVDVLVLRLSSQFSKSANFQEQALLSMLSKPVAQKVQRTIGGTTRVVQELEKADSQNQILKSMISSINKKSLSGLKSIESSSVGSESMLYTLPNFFNRDNEDIQILIRRESKEEEQQANSIGAQYHLDMRLDIGDQGKMLAKVKLVGSDLSLNLYAEKSALKTKAEKYLPMLQERLESFGITITQTECYVADIPEQLLKTQLSTMHIYV